MTLHYYDPHRLPDQLEKQLGLTYHETLASLVKVCDVVNFQTPHYPSTQGFVNNAFLAKFKREAYLVNTARGALCDRDAIALALTLWQLAGHGGDVWFPQPAPVDHPWCSTPNHGMTPGISGTSLSAQARYAVGTLEILQNFFDGKPIRKAYLIVNSGRLVEPVQTPISLRRPISLTCSDGDLIDAGGCAYYRSA